MKKLLAWIIVVCSALMLIPSGILIYINGWINGLGFMFVMAVPPLIIGILFFRQPFPKKLAIIGVILSLILGGGFTWYAKKHNISKPTMDTQLQKELRGIKDSVE